MYIVSVLYFEIIFKLFKKEIGPSIKGIFQNLKQRRYNIIYVFFYLFFYLCIYFIFYRFSVFPNNPKARNIAKDDKLSQPIRMSLIN